MIDPQKVDLNQIPKTFADGAIGAFNKNLFTFAITSGSQLHTFATTPHIMKSIAVWMQDTITRYEKEHGVIDMTPPLIESPMQASDIKGPEGK